ncbi:MAG TPA: CHAT domain-containing tetratricopeptide repeat protein [Blastocatellia bacterium]|nr:CHAT domain-containing tetratricopeptide repeat protein [Blastocatellia bacterium]
MRLLLYLMALAFLVSVKTVMHTPAQVMAQENSKRIAAESADGEGDRLQRQGTAESLRKAILKYEEALSLWRSGGERAGEAETLTKAAKALNSLGERQKALDHHQRAIALWEAIGDDKGRAKALAGVGDVYYAMDEHHRARDYFNQSLLLYRSLGDQRGEATTLNGIGVTYFVLGEPQKALDYYLQALPMLRIAGDREEQASTLNNIAVVFRVMGESQQALEYFEQSLALNREAGDLRQMAIVLTNIGALHFRLGAAQRALDYYSQSLPLRRSAGDQAGQAITLTNIGAAHLALGATQQAMESLNQALLLAQSAQSRSLQAQALNILAIALSREGENRKALESLHQALELWRAIGERQGEFSALVHLGRNYRELGELRPALDHLEQALHLTGALGETGGEAAVLADLARVARDLGNLDKAQNLIETSLDLVETLRARIRAEDLRVAFLASKQSDYEFYIDLLMRLHEQQPSAGYDARAIEACERARGRSLLDVLVSTRADISQGADPALLDRQRTLQRQINAKERVRARLVSEKQIEKAAAMEKELRSLLAEYQELKGQIIDSSPRYAALTDPVPLKLTEIQRTLDRDTLLLEYALGEDRSFLWAVTPSSLRAYTLPGRAEIEKLTSRAYQRLIKSNQRVYLVSAERAMADLSRTVLGAVAVELEGKRLVIVSDGALQYVPFGALPAPAVGGGAVNKRRPLIADHEVVSLPSASVLATMRREMAKRQVAPRSVAVFSDPVFRPDDPRIKRAKLGGEKTSGDESHPKSILVGSADEIGMAGFERLIHTRREAEDIIAQVPQGQGFKALDFAASRATVMNSDLDEYRIVHFATHGLLNSRHPELSGIVLSLVDEQGRAQEGFLRAHEIYNLKLNADLVVLSACSTALGKEIRGEGLAGLTRGFMYAGSPRVIASLWNVRDEATAVLMKRFYQNLLTGKSSPAAALRQAQVSMWQEPRWQAPYYWAGFTLQGEWN